MAEDYKKLSGIQRAAAFMLSLSEDKTAAIFAKLTEEEIRDLSIAMANLGTVKAPVLEKVFVDFVSRVTSTGSLVGSLESTESYLAKILPKEKVATIMEEIRGPAGRTMWDKLGNVSEEVLAGYLKNEYPQTVAVIFSKIKPEQAAKVIALLPEELSQEVLLRMLKMEAVQKDILDDVEKTLRREFMNNLARTTQRNPLEVVAEIFNSFDRSTEERFMEALEARDHDAAERIKALMFTFEDLMKLGDTAMQAVIRVSDKTKLALALKGASLALRNHFLKNMSERAGKMLQDDIASLGAQRVKDVDEAQLGIVMATKELAASGEISLGMNTNEEEQMID